MSFEAFDKLQKEGTRCSLAPASR